MFSSSFSSKPKNIEISENNENVATITFHDKEILINLIKLNTCFINMIKTHFNLQQLPMKLNTIKVIMSQIFINKVKKLRVSKEYYFENKWNPSNITSQNLYDFKDIIKSNSKKYEYTVIETK
jgi:hypothetical protein